MAKLIWLSFPLGISDPRPPAIPPPTLSPLYTIETDGANVQTLRVASHTGTHVDAPRHVIADGVCITDFSPAELIFTKPAVIELPLSDATIVRVEDLQPVRETLDGADIALFRFGYGAVRRNDPARFSARCPGFGVESARWLRENCPGLCAIGMDVPSLACIAYLEKTMAAHHELLSGEGCRFLIIEDMNLEGDLTGLREVHLCPWLVQGMDSGPCVVVGVIS